MNSLEKHQPCSYLINQEFTTSEETHIKHVIHNEFERIFVDERSKNG
jgi:hypothetical protein